MDSVEFFDHFNSDQLFRSFFKSRRYSLDSIDEVEQAEVEDKDLDVSGILLVDVKTFIRFTIDCSLELKSEYLKELSRLINAMDKYEQERHDFCEKFLLILEVGEFDRVISKDGLGPYTTDSIDHLDLIDALQILRNLPKFLREKAQEVSISKTSSSEVTISTLFKWNQPASKFIELIHTLKYYGWIDMPLGKTERGPGFRKVAIEILKHIDFNDSPSIDTLETHLKDELAVGAETAYDRHPKLFDSYGGPHFLNITNLNKKPLK